MSKTTLKLLIHPEKNSLTFSRNYRIFSTQEPVNKITGFTDLVEDVIVSPSEVDINNLKRYFRYSRNKEDWSLWYEIEPGNLGDAGDLLFEDYSDFYFELKYMYDDGTTDEIASPIEINEIKIRLSNASTTPNTFSPIVFTSDEQSANVIYTTDPQFKPYAVDSAVGLYKELSLYTNKMFGHPTVYFRTVPESDSGDFIFKEWTLFKNVDRKCIKILVPGNKFPSNAPRYQEYGIDYENLPFEVHIDHNYFQSIFGKASHPRQRDFLYFPLINRMFEVSGCFLHRAFMMSPTYWKVSLKKYNPNVDMLLTDDSRSFLDNVIQSAEELFNDEVEDATSDAIMPDQYSTISRQFDSSRNAIHPDLRIRMLDYKFNYNSLIEDYYDLEPISAETVTYELNDTSPVDSENISLQNLEGIDDDRRSYNVILAYQNSGPYKAWRNNALITGDKNVKDSSYKFIRVRGPVDSIPDHDGDSEAGRYIRIEAYSDLSFTKQRNIMSTDSYVNFKIRENAVVYNANPVFNSADVKNISFTCLFNVKSGADILNFISGYDNETNSGLKISGQFDKYFGSNPEGDFTLNIQLNGDIISNTINSFKSGDWYAMVVSISNEFKQLGIYVYSMKEDPGDLSNHTDFINVFNSITEINSHEFSLDTGKYYLPSSNMLISNIRLFNTMIKEEQHDFILSQRFLKDESKLIIIDNCKPQLDLPYIGKNR